MYVVGESSLTVDSFDFNLEWNMCVQIMQLYSNEAANVQDWEGNIAGQVKIKINLLIF